MFERMLEFVLNPKTVQNSVTIWDAFVRLDPTAGGLRAAFDGDCEEAARGLRGDLGEISTGAFPRQIPPGRRPFRARMYPITTPGSKRRYPTCHWPEAPRR